MGDLNESRPGSVSWMWSRVKTSLLCFACLHLRRYSKLYARDSRESPIWYGSGMFQKICRGQKTVHESKVNCVNHRNNLTLTFQHPLTHKEVCQLLIYFYFVCCLNLADTFVPLSKTVDTLKKSMDSNINSHSNPTYQTSINCRSIMIFNRSIRNLSSVLIKALASIRLIKI